MADTTALFRLLADLVVIAHLAFVVFAAAGGTLVVRSWRWAWLHLPAAAWGAAVELGGWVCPLTPAENWLRRQGGTASYEGGFVEHYLLPVLYPSALTRESQLVLGFGLVAINVCFYWVAWTRYRRRERSRADAKTGTHAAAGR